MPRDAQAVKEGVDAEMTDKLIDFGDCRDTIEVIGEGRSMGMLQGEGDARGRVAPTTCTKPDEAPDDGGVEAGLSEVAGGSGADVGQPPVGRMGDGAEEELAVGTGPAADRGILN